MGNTCGVVCKRKSKCSDDKAVRSHHEEKYLEGDGGGCDGCDNGGGDDGCGDDGCGDDGCGDDGSGVGMGIVMWKTTVPFVPPVKQGTVIKVYDGDTITIAAKLPYKASPLYRFSVRLNGIDTPELKTNNPVEKRVAILARDALAEKILNKKITLTDVKTEKYGRILAVVHCNGLNMNEWLIQERFAVEYDGGTKKSPENWEDYHRGE